MTIRFICLILFLSLNVHGQKYLQTTLGINHPVKYSSAATIRKIGIDIGIGKIRSINERFNLETKFAINIWSRNYNPNDYYKYVTPEFPIINETNTNKSYRRTNFDINSNLLIHFILKTFVVKSGVGVYFKNIVRLDSFPGLDPEVALLEKDYSDDSNLLLGLNYTFALSYSASNRVTPYLEYSTSIIDIHNTYPEKKRYGLIAIGLQYRLTK